MYVECPRCQTKYFLEKFGNGGGGGGGGGAKEVKSKCMKCGEVFLVISTEDDVPTMVNKKETILQIPNDKRIYLEVVKGAKAGNTYQILKPLVTIGRGSKVDLIIAESDISRKHCVLEVSKEKTVLRDLESTNGTYVTGDKIDSVTLRDKTEFEVGNTRLRYIEVT